MASFAGQVAVVTGAGKGLGKAYALWLASQGCSVVVNNRGHAGAASSARAVADEIIASGGRAIAHEAAIDQREQAEDLIACAERAFGGLDILVCNAGVLSTDRFADVAEDELRRVVDTNIWGTVYPLAAAWPRLLERQYGRVVLSSSSAGLYGLAGSVIYGASRSAIIGLGRSLAAEVPEGVDICVNIVMPFAYTPLTSKITLAYMKDVITPDMVAPVVGWLCSEDCRESGAILHAGGGRVTRARIVESRSAVVLGAEPSHWWTSIGDLGGAPEARDAIEAGARMIQKSYRGRDPGQNA